MTATASDDPKPGAYAPYVAARRPGGHPGVPPKYRVLVHHQMLERWNDLPRRVGSENMTRFWDHVAHTPGAPPTTGTSCVLKGKAGKPKKPGFSRTVHFEVGGAERVDYQYNEAFVGAIGDSHPVVWILAVTVSSH